MINNFIGQIKRMPKQEIEEICKEIKQEKQAQAREDYRNFIKTKMKKRGKR